ncbi:MAG: four helix bundle protein [Chitinophagaceae bacterium]|jgi:four helix bundle protein|nr:four helix bundle protein [Chitinophagaceae bacterium]
MSSSNSYKGFKELDCWKKGRDLRNRISILVKKLPPEEKFQLASQMIRASRSVTNNMAEGYGRYTYSDTRHFFIQARGSVTETIDRLVIAFDENYISQEDFLEIEIMCETVFKLINGYINYLDKQKKL